MVCFGLYLLGVGFLSGSIDGWVPGLGTFLAKFVSCAGRYESFAKGVVDNRDVLYFVIGTVLFLVLNGFWLEGRMRPRAKAIFTTAVVVSAGIFLMGNWFLSEFALGRFDLTEGKIYTLSPATKKILSEVKAPVTAKLYISPSEKMPTGMKTLEQEIIGKFDELRVVSGGKFQYKIFHMEAANVVERDENRGEPSMEEQLQSKGIQPFQVQSIETDEVGVRLIYASISFAYKEKPEEIIPRIMPDTVHELEYLIVSKIFRMTMAEEPRVALVAPYQEKAVDENMMALLAQLGGQVPPRYRDDEYEIIEAGLRHEGYQVDRIGLNREETIPEGVPTLILLEPERLNDRQRYEINRFLAEGGSVFMGVQNYEFDYDPSGGRLTVYGNDKNPEVNSLLEPWGLEVDRDILADEQSEVISLAGGAQLGPFAVSVPVKLPIQIIIPPSGMNEEISITSRLSSLFYLWGSALRIDGGKAEAQGLKVFELLQSSKNSWTVPFKAGAMTPPDFARTKARRTGPFPLAVLVTGQFADGFQGRTVPAWPREEEANPETQTPENLPALEPKPGKLVLVGASSIFQRQLIRSGGHLTFLLNAVDVLTLGDELVQIRSKIPIDRSIGRVSKTEKVLARFFVMILVPLVIALIGGFRVFLRRQSKQQYLRTLESRIQAS